MIKYTLLGAFCLVLCATIGSLVYVGYHNTKVQIQTEKEKQKTLPPVAEEETKKEKVDTENTSEPDADIRHLSANMRISVNQSTGDIRYMYQSEGGNGFVLEPYVKRKAAGGATLYVLARYVGEDLLGFNQIRVKTESREDVLEFPPGEMQYGEQGTITLEWYDMPTDAKMEDILRHIAASKNVTISMIGHEDQNKNLSPEDIDRIKNVLALYDKVKQ